MTGDPIDDLLRSAAARAELGALLDGKTDDERRDILIGLLWSAAGQLSRQNDALAALVGTMTGVIEGLGRRIAALEEPRNARGPFVRPKRW